jgi:hypothetical protein
MVDDSGNDVSDLFTSIYNQEALGRNKDIGLIDPDKK